MNSGKGNHVRMNVSPQIKERVGEAELYLSQGLFDQARGIYQELLEEIAARGTVENGDEQLFLEEQLRSVDRYEAKFLGTGSLGTEEAGDPAEDTEEVTVFNRGLALLDVGLTAEALNEFQLARQLGYPAVECYLQMARAHLQLGRPAKAISTLQEALQLPDIHRDDRLRLQEQLASAHEADGNKAVALDLYGQILEVNPHHRTVVDRLDSLRKEIFDYHINLAKLNLESKQFLKAIEQLRLLYRRFQFPADSVLPLFHKILALAPDNLDALRNLAEISSREGNWKKALAYLEKIQDIQPREPWSEKQLTHLYQRLTKADEVSAEDRLKAAHHFLRAGQLESAVNQYLEVILEETSHRLVALVELGEALLKSGDYDRLVEVLGNSLPWISSLKPSPEVFSFYFLLGSAYEKKDCYDEAQKFFMRAAKIDPHNEAVREKLGTHSQEPLHSCCDKFGIAASSQQQYRMREKLGQNEILQFFKVSEIPGDTIRIAKRLLPHFSKDKNVQEFFSRWWREQRAMQNPHVVRVLDVAEREGHYYLITEEQSTTLQDKLKDKAPLPLASAVHIAKGLLNALAYAHSHRGTDDVLRKIFHLGLTPQRIFVDDELQKVKIADFGLIYLLDRELGWWPHYSERSSLELAYMAPEQFSRSPRKMPDKMKQATDLYAFGVIFYQMLTGHLPFTGPDPDDFRKQHLEKYPVQPRAFISAIPAKLDETVLRCLRKDPKKRWRTPTELDLAL
ncbi:MAG: tetratricopeptide repeat protein, partial [Deltaproteobacteria bacterium]|nr:tetratricopeptide repeat protein [Deltaproteobacteria bacterium]